MSENMIHDKKQYAQSPDTGIFTIYQPDSKRTAPLSYDEITCNCLGEISRRGKNDFVLYCWVYDSQNADDEGYYCEIVPDITSLMRTEESDNKDEMFDLAHRAVFQCLGDRINPNNEYVIKKLRKDLGEKLIDWALGRKKILIEKFPDEQ